LTLADITLVHRGVVPAVGPRRPRQPRGHEQVRDHAADGLEGILSVAARKFTTARAVAERVTDTLLSKLQHAPVAVPHRVDAAARRHRRATSASRSRTRGASSTRRGHPDPRRRMRLAHLSIRGSR
jgi:glycerol-3-phosphate dehydrogenase